MIFDPEIELQLLESQPEWIGIKERIGGLKKDIEYYSMRLDKDPAEWIAKKITMLESDLNFYGNILALWITNYNKLKSLSEAVEKQSRIANEGERILSLVEDLRIAYTFHEKLDFTLCDVTVKIANEKGIDTDKMKNALKDLSVTVHDYSKHMFKELDKEIDRITNE